MFPRVIGFLSRLPSSHWHPVLDQITGKYMKACTLVVSLNTAYVVVAQSYSAHSTIVGSQVQWSNTFCFVWTKAPDAVTIDRLDSY